MRRSFYKAHETERMASLDGVELAGFLPRAIAFLIDCAIAMMLLALAVGAVAAVIWYRDTGGQLGHYAVRFELESWYGKLVLDILVPVLYFGLTTWLWNGQTVGKRLLRIRVVSLVHSHMTLWHSVERALGYGAACLEFGFGFFQYFIHPNRRTVQDRIAETIVVREQPASAANERE